MNINYAPAIAAVQFLPPLEQERVCRLLETRAQRNPRFRDRLDAAKAKAEAEERAHEAWICQQAADREAARMEDVPW